MSLLPSAGELESEPAQWAYYPWLRTVVRIPGPGSYRRLRLDRNRNKLTLAEMQRACNLTVGVIGLSVGNAIALTLALEGLAGEIRLADFDALDITNLNRVPASIADTGTNKAIVAAHRIAEIDPYITTRVHTDGITKTNIEEFVDGVDIVIEECDSFDIKVLVREVCRRRGIPVLMETSDGGTLDVERFDLEPDRPLFHGLVGELSADELAGLDRAAITPLAVRVLEPERVTAHMAASALELGRTVSAWPQLGGDVLLGGATVAAAVRRLVQGRPLPSGRVRFDRDRWLDGIDDPLARPAPADTPIAADASAEPGTDSLNDAEVMMRACARAPSAGNQKPWTLRLEDDMVVVALDPTRSSTLDIDHRASAVAVGAAVYNVEVAAQTLGRLGSTDIIHDAGTLTGQVRLTPADGRRGDPADLQAVLARSTQRRPGDRSTPPPDHLAELRRVAATEHTRLVTLTDAADIAQIASILAASDRIRFLTPQLHAEMFAELTDDPSASRGIPISALDLPASMLTVMDILRRPDVMALLEKWDGGSALGADAGARASSASAFAVLMQQGRTGSDYVRAGRVMQRLWLRAEELGYRVHPMTPCFLYAHSDEETARLSPPHADELIAERRSLLGMVATAQDDLSTPTIVLRLSR
ncbi:Rv1355c family protein [Gordonia bronchialis]|uniref:Rv1355c family protein n=1 Tax=Gordonia bronchialis TaxID=2054 RepID=UPI0022706D97|nr:Rv1355c family protein [Gordonia bronchialis]